MFPLEYPTEALACEPATRQGALDPFCGRGTTLYAARCAGRPAFGLDTNPVAVAIARAKLARTDARTVLALARRYLDGPADAAPQDAFFDAAFHPATLAQLVRLRAAMAAETTSSEALDVLRAALLGCLHGPLGRDPARATYLSNHMPRTVAFKPRSSLARWARTGTRAPQVDVLDVLARKLERLDESLARGAPDGEVRCADARDADAWLGWEGRFETVVTSPPYYGLRSYGPDQWLRAWLLGAPPQVQYGRVGQLAHGSVPAYVEALGLVWRRCSQAAPGRLVLHVRFGDIPSRRLKVREVFSQALEASGVRWRLCSCEAVRYERGARQARQMGAGADVFEEFDFRVERQ